MKHSYAEIRTILVDNIEDRVEQCQGHSVEASIPEDTPYIRIRLAWDMKKGKLNVSGHKRSRTVQNINTLDKLTLSELATLLVQLDKVEEGK